MKKKCTIQRDSVWRIPLKLLYGMRKGLSLSICLYFAVSHVSAADDVQNPISLDIKNATVESAMKTIEEKSGYSFFYNNSQIDFKRKVTISVGNADINAVLEALFAGTDVNYTILDRNIVLTNQPLVSGARPATVAQTPSHPMIRGVVIDDLNQPIVGASVVVMGSSVGTSTDIDGKFSLDTAAGVTLEVAYLGMTPAQVRVNAANADNIVIIMQPDLLKLDEVVVVGYGVQRRSDVTGAISSVTPGQLNSTPTTSLGEMIRGNAAGVQVKLTNAAPGGSSSIIIRGERSLSGNNTPLYIVDGVPVRDIDDINSNDIESLEILKDASAQSIYGARAAHGVVLVTTKRGSSGKLRVDYSGYMAVQSVHRNFEFYDGEEWAALRREAYYNAYGGYDESSCFNGIMLDVLNSGEFTDWESLMIQPALQQNHNISIQSGTDKTKYALMFGYYSQDGLVQSSGFERLTARLNIDQKLTRWLTVGTNISYAKAWKSVVDGTFNSFITIPPLSRVYEDDGVTLRKDVTGSGESNYNPLWNINNSANDTTYDNLLFNLFADFDLGGGFHYRANASITNRATHSNSYQGVEHLTAAANGGKATASVGFYNDYLFENIFNWVKDFNADHHFDATFMQSVSERQTKNIGINGTGFVNDDKLYNTIADADEFGVPTYSLSTRRLLSFMARARYNFKDRYLLSVAMRVDGSSIFGANNKYGYFPSASFAWRIDQESFMRDARWVSNLKLRVSYGQVGNEGTSAYQSLTLTERYLTEFGDQSYVGYLPGIALPNPDLKWETSATTNIGLDFGFFNGRIGGAVEVYDTQTYDMLFNRSVSSLLGYSTQMVNLGRMQNRGVEVTLNTVPVRTKDFSWSLNGTFTLNRNKILSLEQGLDADGNPINDVDDNLFVGSPRRVYYDYVFDGIWQLDDDIANSHMPDAKPGSIKLKDVSGDGKIDLDDRVTYEWDPRFITSLSTTFKYKGFDLTADFYYSHGGYLRNDYLYGFETGGDLTGKRNGLRRNYWTIYNPSNDAPQPNMTQAPAYMSSLSYQDASYFRLQNLTLGYNFPKKISKVIFVDQLRLYATLSNYWTVTEVLAYGPEQKPGDYPEPRTMLFGVKITF